MISVVVENLGVGVLFVLPSIGWIWRGINFRSNVIDQFKDKLPMTEAALVESAASGLRELAHRIGPVLGDGDGPFTPSQALAEPALLLSCIDQVGCLLRARVTVRQYYKWMHRCGPMLTFLGIFYLGASALALAYYSELNRWRWGGQAGLWGAIVAMVVAASIVTSYSIAVHRFDSAQLLSKRDT